MAKSNIYLLSCAFLWLVENQPAGKKPDESFLYETGSAQAPAGIAQAGKKLLSRVSAFGHPASADYPRNLIMGDHCY